MSGSAESGTIESHVEDRIATVTFGHPKSNSLPGALLQSIAESIDQASHDDSARVIVLRSTGEKAFCAGASFDEFLAVSTIDESRTFFSGFAKVLTAIRKSPKIVICRIQGKVVGGGVGIAAAADYAIATENSLAKLSELALGIGPFIIGPAVERKVGRAHFGMMAIDADWKDAEFCRNAGLYAKVVGSIQELDTEVEKLAHTLAEANPEAMRELKSILWKDTDHWDSLLMERVGVTAKLALTEFVQAKIKSFKAA